MHFKFILTLFVLIQHQHQVLTYASGEKSSDLCDTSPRVNDVYVQHTMHRISDPKVSLPFYTEVLGMTLLDTANLVMDTSSQFTMFFLAYEDPENIPIDDEERRLWAMSYPGAITCSSMLCGILCVLSPLDTDDRGIFERPWATLEHIWGDEVSQHEYSDDNATPTGYSHIGIFASDVYEFCDRLMEYGVTFIKKPDEGYWIEIMNPYKMTLAE